MKTYFYFVKSYKKLFASAKKVEMGKSAAFGDNRGLADIVKFASTDKIKELKAKLKKCGYTPRVLIFAPHPDDECMNTLPLRFMTECGFEVIDAAVTLGSNVARRKGRLAELTAACNFLGWKISKLAFDAVNPKTRKSKKEYWAECVEKTAALIDKLKPAVIIAPHALDWNQTHIGTSMLVSDALQKSDWNGVRIEAELWQAMDSPNLLIEVSDEILSAEIGALSCHTEEVARNPYHLNLVAYYTDNVRRGAELVGGQGGTAPSFQFGQIYRVLEKRGKVWKPAFDSKIITAKESVSTLLENLWK